MANTWCCPLVSSRSEMSALMMDSRPTSVGPSTGSPERQNSAPQRENLLSQVGQAEQIHSLIWLKNQFDSKLFQILKLFEVQNLFKLKIYLFQIQWSWYLFTSCFRKNKHLPIFIFNQCFWQKIKSSLFQCDINYKSIL